MNNPTIIQCPNCFGPMKKDRRVEECGYCGSMVEWYKGPELPREMQEARQRIMASNQWSTMSLDSASISTREHHATVFDETGVHYLRGQAAIELWTQGRGK